MLNTQSGKQDSTESTTPKRSAAPKMASHHGQSLNHLLNFTLPPRQYQVSQNIPRRSRKNASSHQVWNKERE